MKKARYDQLPFAESLAALTQQRTEMVALLESLAPDAWRRIALVHIPYDKSEWRLTLQERVWGMVDHEEGHCTQMEEVAAALKRPSKPGDTGRGSAAAPRR